MEVGANLTAWDHTAYAAPCNARMRARARARARPLTNHSGGRRGGNQPGLWGMSPAHGIERARLVA